jgi:hypothetical protein
MYLITFVSEERLDRSIERGKAWWYRHFPRIAAWRFGPATSPPQYDEETALIGATTRPDSQMLPNYGGIRKDVEYLIEIDDSQKEMGQDD